MIIDKHFFPTHRPSYRAYLALTVGLIVASTIVAPRASSWTRLSPDWTPGSLIPHKFVQHHHGQTSGTGEWLPDFAQIATVRVDTGGRWSEIFADAELTGDDIVLIPSGMHVVYDVVRDHTLKAVVVHGDLQFDPNASTLLTLETLWVESGGGLTIVPANRDVTSTIVFSGQIDVNEDPRQIGLGLVVDSGRVDVQGTSIGGIGFTESAVAGIQSLTLDKARPWRAGDLLVLPDIREGGDAARWDFSTTFVSQLETVPIASIDGKFVRLVKPLVHDHLAGGGAFVGMISRNVIFMSDIAGGGARGHILFGGHSTVQFNHALLLDLGRTTVAQRDDTTMDSTGQPTHIGTNQRARYALHAHHVHMPVTFHGNAIAGHDSAYGSERYGIVLHDSRGDVRHNIIVGARGSGIFLEDGVETGVVEANLVIGDGGGSDLADDIRFGPLQGEDMGAGGFGVWARGPLVAIRNNIATGYFPQAAFSYYTHNNYVSGIVPQIEGNPPQLAGKKIRIAQTPIQHYGAFSGNIAHGHFRQALGLFYLQPPEGQFNRIEDFTAIMLSKTSQGVHLHHGHAFVLGNPTIYGAGGGAGLYNNTGYYTSVHFIGGSLQRVHVGIFTPRYGGLIQGTQFSENRYNIAVLEGSGLTDVHNYLGTGKNYRLYSTSAEVPGQAVTLPKVYGAALPLN